MSSDILLARELSRQLWRGERSPAPWGVHGLNGEAVVRARLANAIRDLKQQTLSVEQIRVLDSIAANDGVPLGVLAKTEAFVTLVMRERFLSVDAVVHDADHLPRLAIRLHLIQSLAGRLGHWAVQTEEIPDARTAHALIKNLGDVDWSHYCTLIDRGARFFEASRFRQASLAYLAADRLVRTPAGLIHASACLCQVGDYVGALWSIRAALLEPENTFEGDAQLFRARTLERRLATLIEDRHQEPLDVEEVELLGGDTHDSLPRHSEVEDDFDIEEQPPVLLDEIIETGPIQLSREVIRDRWATSPADRQRREAAQTKRVKLRVETSVRPLQRTSDEPIVVQLIADTYDREIEAEEIRAPPELEIEVEAMDDFDGPTEVPPMVLVEAVLEAADAITTSERPMDPTATPMPPPQVESTETATEQLAFEQVPIHGRIADTAEIDVQPNYRVLDQRNEVTQLVRTLRRPRFPVIADP